MSGNKEKDFHALKRLMSLTTFGNHKAAIQRASYNKNTKHVEKVT